MRNFIILLLLAGGGYFAYIHWDQGKQRAAPLNTATSTTSEPYAIRLLSRSTRNGPLDFQVSVVSGNRWRVEYKGSGSRPVLVAISNGTETVWNEKPGGPPVAAASFDPRPMLNLLLSGAARIYKAESSTPQRIIEQVDGHACMKATFGMNGITTQMWIDSSDGFPVCSVGTINGAYQEVHLSQLPIDFTQPGTEEFFNTAHLKPFFTGYLNP